MSLYRITAEIHAPAERVWEVLSTVESWPRWLPTVVNVEALEGMPLRLGARFRLVQPKLRRGLANVSAETVRLSDVHRF